ncbi:MAG TPA: siderophore-interacting protein [Stenotrophomonas sp.]|jgi:NADPH-dependent ferric siderophore reductase
MTTHTHQRLRHEVRMRPLQVLRIETITPAMRRIVFGGEALAGFHSASPDDHVKLFFPNAQGAFVTPTMTPDGPRYPEGQVPSQARDYTPRWHDAEAGELAIDFVLHGDGLASTWATHAQPGDTLMIGGPRGSFVVANDYDQYVLLGDETALPAIGRWLEELDEDAIVDVYVEIEDEAERQLLTSAADVRVHWLERNGVPAAESRLLEETLRDFELPDGDTFYWIATESRRARMMRKFIEGQWGVPHESVRASGYWQAGPDHDE